MNLYTKLNEVKNEDELGVYEAQILDRFGELPSQVEDLLASVKLKWIASRLGIEKLILKNGKMVGYFIQNQESSFYQSKVFGELIQYVQKNPKVCTMKEKKTRNGLRLILTFEDIKSVQQAIESLSGVHGVAV